MIQTERFISLVYRIGLFADGFTHGNIRKNGLSFRSDPRRHGPAVKVVIIKAGLH
jgi:hypothetical protein